MTVFYRFIRLGLLGAVLLAGMNGCIATTPQVNAASSVRLTVTATGAIVFQGRTLPLDDMSRALRHAGVRPHQEIRVQMDDPHDLPTMRRVTELLATGGFQPVVFVSTRHVSAEVLDANAAARKPDGLPGIGPER